VKICFQCSCCFQDLVISFSSLFLFSRQARAILSAFAHSVKKNQVSICFQQQYSLAPIFTLLDRMEPTSKHTPQFFTHIKTRGREEGADEQESEMKIGSQDQEERAR
jgi:hypothetical protein